MQLLTNQRTTAFSPTCIEIMDFFLSHADCYFTPKTASLSMGKSYDSVKNCMNLLKINSYLSKESNSCNNYHITKENLEYWGFDLKNRYLSEVE